MTGPGRDQKNAIPNGVIRIIVGVAGAAAILISGGIWVGSIDSSFRNHTLQGGHPPLQKIVLDLVKDQATTSSTVQQNQKLIEDIRQEQREAFKRLETLIERARDRETRPR